MSLGTVVIAGEHLLFMISAALLSWFDWRRSAVLTIGSLPAVLGLVLRLVWTARSHPEQIQAVYNSVLFIPLYLITGVLVTRYIRWRCSSRGRAGDPIRK